MGWSLSSLPAQARRNGRRAPAAVRADCESLPAVVDFAFAILLRRVDGDFWGTAANVSRHSQSSILPKRLTFKSDTRSAVTLTDANVRHGVSSWIKKWGHAGIVRARTDKGHAPSRKKILSNGIHPLKGQKINAQKYTLTCEDWKSWVSK